MIDALRRILDAVTAKTDFHGALQLLVSLLRQAMDADVASIFMLDREDGCYVLRATDGLEQEAVGRARLSLNEGLVGLVGAREEPLNLANASEHPQFQYLHGTGEEAFSSFLIPSKLVTASLAQLRTSLLYTLILRSRSEDKDYPH